MLCVEGEGQKSPAKMKEVKNMDNDKMELFEALIAISVVSKMLAQIVLKGDEEDEGKNKCHNCSIKGMCDKAH